MLIALFPKVSWSKEKIVSAFKAQGHEIKSSELRIGFSHLALIKSDEVDFSQFKSQEKIILVRYDQEKQELQRVGFIIENNEFKNLDVEYEINNDQTNFVFDIKNFGYKPQGTGDFKKTIENVNNSMQGKFLELLKTFDCEDLLEKENIPPQAKKLIVDIYALIATNFELQFTLQTSFYPDDSKNFIKFYSSILSCTFITRAEIEKIIQLISVIDPAIDYSTLQGSKSIRRTFQKLAEKTEFELTKEFARSISNIEILDDNFRTPEAHKMSRILGVLNNLSKETYGSLINEVLASMNGTNQFYKKLCDYLRK
jgi:hypothetical protein